MKLPCICLRLNTRSLSYLQFRGSLLLMILLPPSMLVDYFEIQMQSHGAVKPFCQNLLDAQLPVSNVFFQLIFQFSKSERNEIFILPSKMLFYLLINTKKLCMSIVHCYTITKNNLQYFLVSIKVFYSAWSDFLSHFML